MEFLKTVEDKHLLRYCQLYIRQKKIEILLQGIQNSTDGWMLQVTTTNLIFQGYR